jgi:hypothetical protein
MSITPDEALKLLVAPRDDSCSTPEWDAQIAEAEAVLRGELKREPLYTGGAQVREWASRTTDVCPVCEAPGVTVQDKDGTAHFERTEPEVLIEAERPVIAGSKSEAKRLTIQGAGNVLSRCPNCWALCRVVQNQDYTLRYEHWEPEVLAEGWLESIDALCDDDGRDDKHFRVYTAQTEQPGRAIAIIELSKGEP